MKIALLLNSNRRLCGYCETFRQLIIINDLPYTLIDPNSENLIDELKGCTHLLFRHSQGDTDPKIYEVVYYISRLYGLKCFPDLATFWPYEDKIREYFLLKANGFPVAESRVFWNKDLAGDFLKSARYPLVVKLPKGAGSTNVIKINSSTEGDIILRQVFIKGVKTGDLHHASSLTSLRKKGVFSYGKRILRKALLNAGLIVDHTYYPEYQIQKDAILLQKFLSDNDFDTRVTVIGNRAFAFRRFVRDNDFRASGSGKLSYDINMIDMRCIETALRISAKLKFTTMAYDFIFDEMQNPKINEISYCFVDKFVGKCQGYWDENLKWHEGRNWPQYYQLIDFLGVRSLRTVPLVEI